MNLRQTLARNLADLMHDRPGLETQMQVAQASGIAQTTISRILRAATNVTLDHIEQLCAAFGVTPADLLLSEVGETSRRPAPAVLSPQEWTEVERFVAQTLSRRYGERASFATRVGHDPKKHKQSRTLPAAKKHRAA